ncbi:hypothetical protein BCS42_03515 [Crenothrix sp. D3]|nr:hypothetical protein BCS42_03515 [Crenothrix sp. D3]
MKVEDVYLKGYTNVTAVVDGLLLVLRRHQSLGYETPKAVYLTATGSGAKIVDRFSSGRKVILPAG